MLIFSSEHSFKTRVISTLSLCKKLSPVTSLATLIFDKFPTKKIFDQLFIFTIMHQHAKIPSVHSSDTDNFRVPSPDWQHPFLTVLTPKIFNHLLTCVKLPASKISVNSISSFSRSINPEYRDQCPETSGHSHF